jgi:hypothetical protein
MNSLVCFMIGAYRTFIHLDDYFMFGWKHSGHDYQSHDEYGYGNLVCKRCGKISKGES